MNSCFVNESAIEEALLALEYIKNNQKKTNTQITSTPAISFQQRSVISQTTYNLIGIFSPDDIEVLRLKHPKVYKAILNGEQFAIETGKTILNRQNNNVSYIEPPKQEVFFPEVTENKCAISNALIRASIFGVFEKGRRNDVSKNEARRIASQGNYAISTVGYRMDQDDLTLLLVLIFNSRYKSLGRRNYITRPETLSNIGITNTTKNWNNTLTRLDRIASTLVKIKIRENTFNSTLIKKYVLNELINEIAYYFDEDMKILFSDADYTYIDWPIRMALKGNHLAQWYHCFCFSNIDSYEINFSYLHEISGSTGTLKKFRENSIDAFKLLKNACANHGKTFDWTLVRSRTTNSGVIFKHTPSISQQRHRSLSSRA